MSKSKINYKSIIAWAFYDWANSAFSSIITTFVFATYFTEAVAKNKIVGTAQWGDAIATAGLLVAILSPPLGAIADRAGFRKPWLAIFSMVTIIASAMLWFTKPDHAYVSWALTWVITGTIGLEISMVFYNAMLSDIAPRKYLGRCSGWGWGLGYLGGLTCLSLVLYFFIDGHATWLPLNTHTSEQIRIVGPIVALWFLAFGWPIFIFTPDKPRTELSLLEAMRSGLKTLYNTLKSLNKYKEVLKLLLARMLYIDGLNTIFAFGGIYAAGTFHMTFSQVVEFGITLNFGAGIGAALFAWVDDAIGSKITILITLSIMTVSGIGMLIVQSQLAFWILGIILSLCVGPVQAASRSLLIRLAPHSLITEMFGLYAFSGKATAFIGPWVLALVTYWSDSQRIGMSTVIIFLIGGALILSTVKE